MTQACWKRLRASAMVEGDTVMKGVWRKGRLSIATWASESVMALAK